MSDKKISSDAVEWMFNRYIKDDPDAQQYLEELRVQADIAQQIYDIREKLRMTRRELAEYSGLSPETIEDLEEIDFEGDWEEAIEKINAAFQNWFVNVVLPAARMKPEEYAVKTVGL